MAKRLFSEDEMARLRSNTHVIDVKPSVIYFTAEFKQLFWERHLAGKKPAAIFMEFGIDPEILGSTRVAGFPGAIRTMLKAGKGFRDSRHMRDADTRFMSKDVMIEYLRQQLEYKDQEIDFLKKIVSLGQTTVDT